MATDHLYDYRVTIESRSGATRSVVSLSSAKIEEGQAVTVGGQRCIVSNVSPDPQVHPGKAQIIFVHCFVVGE